MRKLEEMMIRNDKAVRLVAFTLFGLAMLAGIVTDRMEIVVISFAAMGIFIAAYAYLSFGEMRRTGARARAYIAEASKQTKADMV